MRTHLPILPAGVVEEIAATGAFAAARGWVPATSGNFSCRVDERSFAITRSAVEKGAIGAEDVILVALDEPLPAGVSAEAPLHAARYASDSSIGAVAHMHSVAATVLSRAEAAAGVLRLEGYEMHKALVGFTTHESTLALPIFANDQDTRALAARIESTLGPRPGVPGYLLAGHGLYTWGLTMADARRHLEGLEFLLTCELEERRLRK
jgi:methylthioribulose-1-phosphate dehydratase